MCVDFGAKYRMIYVSAEMMKRNSFSRSFCLGFRSRIIVGYSAEWSRIRRDCVCVYRHVHRRLPREVILRRSCNLSGWGLQLTPCSISRSAFWKGCSYKYMNEVKQLFISWQATATQCRWWRGKFSMRGSWSRQTTFVNALSFLDVNFVYRITVEFVSFWVFNWTQHVYNKYRSLSAK